MHLHLRSRSVRYLSIFTDFVFHDTLDFEPVKQRGGGAMQANKTVSKLEPKLTVTVVSNSYSELVITVQAIHILSLYMQMKLH